jgi:hypothetical protein
MDEATLLRQGIAAARAKRKSEAYALLRQVVGMDPRNTEAWVWLGAVAPTLPEQLQAFEQAVALDPGNEKAQAGRRWAASKLGVSAPAAPPPAPAPPGRGGLSSQDMMGMFGGMPGAPPPAPAAPPAGGGLSSQDMMGMFGGVPGAPPPAPASQGGGRLSSQEPVNALGGPGLAPPAPSGAAPGGGMFAEDVMGIFGGPGRAPTGPAPLDSITPPPTLPPGAPGTPGGAEWRGFSELEEPNTNFNWDDPGVGLGGYATPNPATADVSPFSWSDVATPPQEAPAWSLPPPSPPSPPPAPYDLEPLAAESQSYAYPLPEEQAAAAAQPRGTFSGWVVVAGVVLIAGLILVSLLLGTRLVTALQSSGMLPQPAATSPDAVVSSFLDAHLSGRYITAADFLAEPLRTDYSQERDDRLPGVPQATPGQSWTRRVAPLAAGAAQAQVYAFITPMGGAPAAAAPVRFLLERRDDRWLITGVVPPPPAP